ncbi:hypothetical protein WEI85_43915 [Actinomycetes bacterium KLBMP 9797]
MRALVLLTAVVALAAGCSAQGGDPRSRIVPESSLTPSPSSSPARAVAKVRQPWQPGARQHGIAIYWENNPNDSDQIVRAKAEKILDHVVALGANAVSLSFPFQMDSATASEVRADADFTPPPRRVAIVLDEANRRALRVAVRPMLHERNLTAADPDMWRGAIRPADRQRWFASYRDMLVGYGKVAAAAKAATFVVGTELTSLEGNTSGWRTVADGLRAVYDGELDYSANHDRLRKAGPAPGVTRSVDAYPPVEVGDSASVARLATGWNAWLDKNRGTGELRDLVLAEVAISARAGAYQEPWSPYREGKKIRPEIQQRWFDTACRVMAERNLAGIYFWMINLDADPSAEPSDDSPMDWLGRPAEKTIKNCFTTP